MSAPLALVTGASRGLGRAMARALGARGWHVAALARTMGGLEELDDEIGALGGECLIIPLDMKDDDGLARMGAALYERFGKLDLLVHCAAHDAPLTPAGHITAKDWDAAFAVNARATQRLIRVVDPLLSLAEAPKALFCIDNRADAPFWGAYGASKRAGEAVARSYAAEQANRKLETVFFEPPAMRTALRARFYPGENPQKLASPAEVAAQALAMLKIGGEDHGGNL